MKSERIPLPPREWAMRAGVRHLAACRVVDEQIRCLGWWQIFERRRLMRRRDRFALAADQMFQCAERS